MGVNRYRFVTQGNGTLQNLSTIKIKKRDTDKFVMYNLEKTRLDRIAGEIYGDDTFWWLILLANPDFGVEFDIPNNTVIRVPFPLQDVVTEFQNKVLLLKDKG